GAVADELARAGEVTVLKTERPRHATELAAASDADAVVVYSGDGGFNETLNGLERDVPVGFLPGGGTSVLSRALGLPPDPVAAARRVAEMGRNRDGKRPGDLAFALAVLRVLVAERGHVEPALEVKGMGRAAFAFVANANPYTYAKGVPLPIVPEADFELGLDMVAPVRIRRRSLVRTAWSVLSGHPRDGMLHAHDVDRIEIVCDHPMPLQADGEDLGDVSEAVFEAERGAVRVLV